MKPSLTKRALHQLRRRPMVALLSVAVSSLGNVGVTVSVGRSAGVSQFGMFSIAFTAYVLSDGLAHAMLRERVIVDRSRGLSSHRVGAVVLVGLLFGAGSLIAGLMLANPFLVWLAIGLPGLALFGYERTISLSTGSPARGLLLDSAWTTVVAGCVVATLVFPVSAVTLFGLWAVSGAVIGTVAALWSSSRGNCVETEGRSRSGSGVDRSDLAFGLDYLLGTGSSQVTLLLVGSVAGLGAIAAIRGAGTVLAPISIVQLAFLSVFLPRQARSAAFTPHVQWEQSIRAVMILVPAITILALGLLAVPDSLGSAFLGDTWPDARSVLPLLSVEAVAAAAATVALVGVRAERRARITLVIRGIMAPIRITSVCLLAWWGGATAAAAGMAGVALVTVAAWWSAYRRTILARRL